PASTIRVWVQRAGASTSPVHQPTYAELLAHNRALRADLSQTQEEVELLKKASAYSANLGRALTVADKARCIAEYAGSLPISRRCEVLGVDRSTYYRHHLPTCPREKWASERAAMRAHHTAVQQR